MLLRIIFTIIPLFCAVSSRAEQQIFIKTLQGKTITVEPDMRPPPGTLKEVPAEKRGIVTTNPQTSNSNTKAQSKTRTKHRSSKR